jgi:hypothetical protein
MTWRVTTEQCRCQLMTLKQGDTQTMQHLSCGVQTMFDLQCNSNTMGCNYHTVQMAPDRRRGDRHAICQYVYDTTCNPRPVYINGMRL